MSLFNIYMGDLSRTKYRKQFVRKKKLNFKITLTALIPDRSVKLSNSEHMQNLDEWTLCNNRNRKLSNNHLQKKKKKKKKLS